MDFGDHSNNQEENEPESS
jgi:hypothetical protein